jgi:NADPH:quinone reductase-like Zn-dependent oxidoreductase
MSDMPAYRIDRFGGPDVLQLDAVPVPQPGSGEVLVRMRAAGVNPVDLKTRAGHYPLIDEGSLPYTLGRDCCGVVEQTGENVKWAPGDEVFAFVGQGPGAYAEYVKLDASALARRPASIEAAVAGAVPLAALTAWQGLFDHGCLERGERVLIHAGAGGVGHFAVQFAKDKGAEVFVTASGDGVEFVRSLGADHVIDYRRQRFEDAVPEVDLVFDLIGGETQTRSWNLVAKGGALISTVAEPSQTEAASRGARGERYTARPDGGQLTVIAELIDKGRVQVRIADTFAFSALPQALARLEEGHVRGKIVVLSPVNAAKR